MKRRRIYFFIGTTAELIKIAPVIKQFQIKKIPFKIITSGQNSIDFSEMDGYLNNNLELIKFNDKSKKSSTFLFFIWAVKAFFTCIFSLRKEFKGLSKDTSFFIVHGDTVSTVIGACIGRFYGLSVVHIESGLRSFHFFEPFPEEICRVITSFLTDIHFAPNKWSINNLRNAHGKKINTLENTLSESYFYARAHSKKSTYSALIDKEKYFLLVVHRQENMFKKDSTKKLISFILNLAAKQKIKCVFVMHHLTKRFLDDAEITETIEKDRQIIFIPRLPYREFVKIFSSAEFIVTDGGSNQEEAYFSGIPCLLLRNYTERIEGLERNVVLSKNKKVTIAKFFKDYKKKKHSQIKLKALPSTIISEYLFKI